MTQSAYAQITQYGMNDRVGNVSFEKPDPGSFNVNKPFSEATSQVKLKEKHVHSSGNQNLISSHR